MPVEVYPLVGAVTVGCSLAVYVMTYKSIHDPDVNYRKDTRVAWEKVDASNRPHLDFLEGKKANDKRQNYMAEHKAENPLYAAAVATKH